VKLRRFLAPLFIALAILVALLFVVAWLPLREAREAFERIYFEQLLGREQSNMSRVAEKAGLERTHLYRKLKALGLPVGRREE
jgi:DNA-binding NtrC family response regulator